MTSVSKGCVALDGSLLLYLLHFSLICDDVFAAVAHV
jgi:hypothetical protein